ncbi:putative lipoprotein [Burkholderia mallei]|nr:putative lipoprotein [Burkholderia mallei]
MAPRACATLTLTDVSTPCSSVTTTKNRFAPRPPAASASGPSEPSSTVSVTLIAICDSCAIASGAARRAVSAAWRDSVGGGAAAARVKPVGDMGRVRTSGPARALLVFWKRSAYEFPGALSTRPADGLTADRGSL